MTSTHSAHRAIVRLDLSAPFEPEPSTLFYLRVSRPEIHDIALSGPFHTLEAIFPNLLVRLHETKAGMAQFEAETEMGRRINQFHSLTGPLDSDPSRTIVIELIRMENADMAARLPGPAYNVLCTEPFGSEDGGKLHGTINGGAAVKRLDVLGCFATLGQAEAFARQALQERVGSCVNGQVQIPPRQPVENSFHGVVSERSGTGRRMMKLVVSVQFDSGAMMFP